MFLDDYAYWIAGLIELYHSTLDICDLERAEQFCTEAIRRFANQEHGGFTLCESGSNELFLNPKDTFDNAMPSGNSVMACNFVRLYQITNHEHYRELAEKQLRFLDAQAQNAPAGHCFFLLTKLLYENPPPHIVIVPKHAGDLQQIHLPYLANCIIRQENADYPLINDRMTFYVCRDQMCFPPFNNLAALLRAKN